MAIADRIGVMNHGRLEQLGTAEDLYLRPASRFVATFIGKCNVIEGRTVAPGRFESRDGRELRFAGGSGGAALCFRPERARLEEVRSDEANSMDVTLKSATYLGPVVEHEVVTTSGDRLLVATPASSSAPRVEPGRKMTLSWRVEDCFAVA